ncbi:hypothetical protein LJR230_004063 [Trinickia sp. LjRoot230]|uniref:hypothetical protein n=1 Tax=Trinickia sp. LjRoot230 TaxID=3342288 RepID=UPI003ED08CBD
MAPSETNAPEAPLDKLKRELVDDHSFAPYQLEEICDALGDEAFQCLTMLQNLVPKFTDFHWQRASAWQLRVELFAAAKSEGTAGLRKLSNRLELEGTFGYDKAPLDKVVQLGGHEALEALRNIHRVPYDFDRRQLLNIVATHGGVDALRILTQHAEILYQHAPREQLYQLATGPNAAEAIHTLAGELHDAASLAEQPRRRHKEPLKAVAPSETDAAKSPLDEIKRELVDYHGFARSQLEDIREAQGDKELECLTMLRNLFPKYADFHEQRTDASQSRVELIDVAKNEGTAGLQLRWDEITNADNRWQLADAFRYDKAQLDRVVQLGGHDALGALRNIHRAPYNFSRQQLLDIVTKQGGVDALKTLTQHAEVLEKHAPREQLYQLATGPNAADVIHTLAGVLHDAADLEEQRRNVANTDSADESVAIHHFLDGTQVSDIMIDGSQEALNIIIENAPILRQLTLSEKITRIAVKPDGTYQLNAIIFALTHRPGVHIRPDAATE